MGIRIRSGAYVPERQVSNDDLARRVIRRANGFGQNRDRGATNLGARTSAPALWPAVRQSDASSKRASTNPRSTSSSWPALLGTKFSPP